MSQARLIYGVDVLEGLRRLEDGSVQCVVTSPPYFGLRDYGAGPQEIGKEEDPDEYIARLGQVFYEVQRVLREDGTLWLNIGDSYANTGSGGLGRKPGDLLMIPARLAMALQADGWTIRQEITWCKPNGMPESVENRPTCKTEKVFLLTKSRKYFFNMAAVRMPAADASIERWNQFIDGQNRSVRANGGEKSNLAMKAVGGPKKALPGSQGKLGDLRDKQRGHSRRHAGFNERWDKMTREEQQSGGANLPNWWVIPVDNYAEAHFATMPRALARICIMASTPPGAVVLDPFSGSGTTGEVAIGCGRRFIGIDLNKKYLDLAKKRLGLFAVAE